MSTMQRRRTVAAVAPPIHRAGGPARTLWRQDVAPTVIAMAAEMGPDELTMRGRPPHGAAGPADLARVAEGPLGRPEPGRHRPAVAPDEHSGLHKRTVRARVEGHFARMLAFDFEPGVKEGRRACTAQGRYWAHEHMRLSESWHPHCHRSSAISRSRPSGRSTRTCSEMPA
jgi:hypothetical protein